MANGTIKKGSLVKNTGGSGGGGSASFPTIVTDSGSSLPVDLTGYQLNDTFLNTSDKKIYKTEINGYLANTNTTLTVNVDYTTGIASGFVSGKQCSRNSIGYLWINNNTEEYIVKFKIKQSQSNTLFKLTLGANPSDNIMFYVSNENKIYHSMYRFSNGSYTTNFDKQILDSILIVDSVYTLKITKTGTSCVAQLFNENGTLLEEKNFTTENSSINVSANINFGSGRIGSSFVYAGEGVEIYLGQSAGELVIPNTSTISWDSGTSITDKTEYADKTNGILYLYSDDELVAIGGSSV